MRAKPAEQERSREKRDLILRVTEDLLREKPFNQISVAEVAAAAGISVATVYQRFNNKHAMGSILLELYYQRSLEWWSQPSNAQQPEQLYDALILVAERSWDQMNALQHIMRPAYLFSREHPELVGTEWDELEKRAAQGFSTFLQQYQDALADIDIEKAAGSISYFFNFMSLGKLLHPNESHWPILRDRRSFAAELAAFSYSYLTG